MARTTTTKGTLKKPARWSQTRQQIFLDHLAASSNVAASERAGMSAGSAYRLRVQSPEFREAWQAALRGIAEADGAARIALVGATMAEARSVMVEGEVEAAIEGMPRALDGHSVVSLVFLRARVVRDADGPWVGRVDYRVRTLEV